MTELQARLFSARFLPVIFGKPLSKLEGFERYHISGTEIIELSPGNFEVYAVAKHPDKHENWKTFLINYINEFNILIDRSEFGLPERDQSPDK